MAPSVSGRPSSGDHGTCAAADVAIATEIRSAAACAAANAFIAITASEYPEVLAQIDMFLAQLAGRRGDRDPAAVENDDVVGDLEHELGVLLDQHDRQPALLELADGRHHL